jgi:hypothetical protein
MKQVLLAVAGAAALWLCTVTANASPSGQATALKISAATDAGVVEQVHWRYHRHYRHYRHYGHYRHYRRW